MIYTVTFNPAIDYVVRTSSVQIGESNRSEKEEIYYGGKGINVSWVLNELGIPSVALGFVAGFTGAAIEQGVQAAGLQTDFVHLESGFSRINIKIKAQEETEINSRGPHIPETEIEALTEKLNRLEDGDTLVLAGSIPPTLPSDMYERILACLEDRKIRFIVDATGDVLRATLRFRPFLVKPNKRELEAFFDVTLDSREELVQYARKMQEQGARNVLVSLGEEGAVLVSENGEVYSQTAYEGKLCNSVGAGDSMVAGFLAGMQKGDYETALRLGTAAGSATAFAEGLASKEEIEALYAPGFF